MRQLLTLGKTWCVLVAILAAMVVAWLAWRPSPAPLPEPVWPIQLHEISGETGIDFRHTDGSGGNR